MNKFDKNVYGNSPLGGNSVDGDNTEGVPLLWDKRVQTYISEQAIEELNDRDLALAQAEKFNKEEEFRQKVGFRRL